MLADSSTSESDFHLLKVENVSKTFPGQRALRSVDLSMDRGEIHALLGPNGSGKSTLIKVLTGFYAPDPGARMWIKGHEASFGSTHRSNDGSTSLAIRAVHQDFGLIGALNAVDNIALGIGYRSSGGHVHWAEQRDATQDLLGRVGARNLDLTLPLDAMDPLHRTQVAIARVLAEWEGHEGLLILDEPTAALPASQVNRLFEIVRELRADGLSVLYVTHRFKEIFDLADRVSVLREGRIVTTVPIGELDPDKLVSLVVGEPSVAARPRVPQRQASAPSERAAALSVSGLRSTELRGIDFTLYRGEILGFAGVVGSGQEELPYVLVGAQRASNGTLHVGDKSIPLKQMKPHRAIELGLGLVPANRAREGIIGEFSVQHNMTLPKAKSFHRRGRLRHGHERRHVFERIGAFDIRPNDPDRVARMLSGGNAQKVVLAKWLGISTCALLMAEPTTGVDVGTRPLIYNLLRTQAEEGLGVIVSSTDVPELVEICHRVIVLREGRIEDELAGSEVTEERILRASLIAVTA